MGLFQPHLVNLDLFQDTALKPVTAVGRRLKEISRTKTI
jgi:hypothetical protein